MQELIFRLTRSKLGHSCTLSLDFKSERVWEYWEQEDLDHKYKAFGTLPKSLV